MITGDSNATAEDIQNLTGFSSVTTSLEEIFQSISTTNLNDMGVYWWHKKKHSNQSSSTPYYLAPTSHWKSARTMSLSPQMVQITDKNHQAASGHGILLSVLSQFLLII